MDMTVSAGRLVNVTLERILNMIKRFFCFLLALLLLLLTACTDKNTLPPDTGEIGQPSASDGDKTDVVRDGKSDFTILVDYGDEAAKVFATYLQNAIAKKTGAFIPMRDCNKQGNYPLRILIGNMAVPDILKVQVAQNGFGVMSDGINLSFFASGVIGYCALESYLSDTLLVSAQKEVWSVQNGTHTEAAATENGMRFIRDGVTQYHLIYSASDPAARPIAIGLAHDLTEQTGLQIKAAADSAQYPNEILLGKVNRAAIGGLEKYLLREDDFASVAMNGTYMILSANRLGLVMGALHLAKGLDGALEKEVTLSADSGVCSRVSKMPKNTFYADAVLLANRVCGTYSTYVDKMVGSSSSAAKDQALVEALIERMGGALTLSVGRSSALYDGRIIKLDTENYQKVTVLSADGHILMAAQFALQYFGNRVSVDGNGYVDVTAYCSQSPDYSLYYHEPLGIAVVTPSDVESFARAGTEINGYTNAAYLARMAAFFNEPTLPEPGSNVEQSRIEVDSLNFETEYIFDYANHTYDTFYSPAICAVDGTNGGMVLYTAYERSTIVADRESATVTYLKRSLDGGTTWETLGEVVEMRWASLFEWDGKLYLLGNHRGNGTVFLAEYDPTTKSMTTADLGLSVSGGAPNTVAIANGRIYKAYNDAVISVSVQDALTVSANWTVSNNPQELISRADYEAVTGKQTNFNNIFWLEEGNVIVTPSGELYVMYRIDAAPTLGHAALFTLSQDGSTLRVVEECNGVVEFPYTQSKFTVRYDETTGRYLSLTSLSTANSVLQRNVLGLVASKDLIHWEIVDVLLVDREMVNPTVSMHAHAFQYVDFVLAGNALYFLVREAVGDTITFHDANYVTLYRIEDYAAWIRAQISD